MLLRTFHPRVTEYDLCFFAFLNTWLQRHHFQEDDPNLEHEKKTDGWQYYEPHSIAHVSSAPCLSLDSNERCLAEGCSSKDTLFELFFVLLAFWLIQQTGSTMSVAVSALFEFGHLVCCTIHCVVSTFQHSLSLDASILLCSGLSHT